MFVARLAGRGRACCMAESSTSETGSILSEDPSPVPRQHLFIIRHGERLDTKNREWKKTAPRPYDTPITPRGEREALRLAKGRFGGKVQYVDQRW